MAKAGFAEQVQGARVASWDFRVHLPKVKVVSGVGQHPLKRPVGMSLAAVPGVDVDRHAGPKLPWVEIVQVHGAHGSPSVSVTGVDHPPDLACFKQVLAAVDKGGHRGPTDGGERGAHPPVFAGVFPRHQQVHVGGFHGPQSMQFRCQHRAKIAVPWRACPSEVTRLC